MAKIKFGTDGWRAVIDKDFIKTNIEAVAQAFADIYPTLPEYGKPVIIGYDRRKMSPEAANMFSEVLQGNDIEVIISKDYCPTPTVSWMVKNNNGAAGVMITASHNPPIWNGIKFKENYGGAASAEYLAPIEQKIDENFKSGKTAKRKSGNQKYFDPFGDYLNSFGKLVDLNKIRSAKFNILFDALYGAGAGYMSRLIGNTVTEIRNEADTNFGGVNPEPIPPHINALIDKMKSGKYDVGLATDGDADRAGAVDENGNFITTHEIYALLIKHAVEDKKWKGKIIKSISTTMMINRLAKKYGFELETVPVGFKYISPAMKNPGVLVGGEESGGFGFPIHVAERDGVFSDLMLLEMMADRGKKIGELVSDLQKEVGPCKYRRLDLHLDEKTIQRIRTELKDIKIKSILGKKLKEHTTIDGNHFLFEDDSWLLFRASGTEPLIRVYAEAPTMDEVNKMIDEGKKVLGV